MARRIQAGFSYSKQEHIQHMDTCNVRQYLKKHPFLSKLLGDSDVLFEVGATAPAPSKDYGHVMITLDRVIIRWWKITLRITEGSIYPAQINETYEDFFHDETGQREIERIFGQNILEYCLNFVRGQIDWLSRLPLNIQIKIISYVNLEDIPQISLVSKLFRSVCRQNDLWRMFYIRYHGTQILLNKDLISLAEKRGWRRVFFTNRLKLQMEIRREAQRERQKHHQEDPSDLIQSKERQKQSQTDSSGQQPLSLTRCQSMLEKKDPLRLSSLIEDELGSLNESSMIETSRTLSPSISIHSISEIELMKSQDFLP